MTHDIGFIEVSGVLMLHISAELEPCSAKFRSMRSSRGNMFYRSTKSIDSQPQQETALTVAAECRTGAPPLGYPPRRATLDEDSFAK